MARSTAGMFMAIFLMATATRSPSPCATAVGVKSRYFRSFQVSQFSVGAR